MPIIAHAIKSVTFQTRSVTGDDVEESWSQPSVRRALPELLIEFQNALRAAKACLDYVEFSENCREQFPVLAMRSSATEPRINNHSAG